MNNGQLKTHNENNFEADKIARINKSLVNHIEYEKRLVLLLKNIIQSARESKIDQIYGPLLNLIEKISLNLESVNLITPLLKEDYRFKISVNLLYRAIIDDNINILYLVAFNEESRVAFENELLILERDYVYSVFIILETQEKINEYFNQILDSEDFPNTTLEVAHDIIKSENSNIFKSDTEGVIKTTASSIKKALKSNKEIRGIFSEDFTKDFQEAKLDQGGTLISAEKKINFIELRKSPHADILTSLNKYYTQFFHFSPKASGLVLNDIEFDLRCYYLSIIQIISMLKIASKALKLDETFEKEINNYVNYIISTNSSQ